jgi:hypothetical protein
MYELHAGIRFRFRLLRLKMGCNLLNQFCNFQNQNAYWHTSQTSLDKTTGVCCIRDRRIWQPPARTCYLESGV